MLALNNPGTIPDTGAYDVYLARRQDAHRHAGRRVHLRDAAGRHLPARFERLARDVAGERPGGRVRGRGAVAAHAVLEGRLSLAALRAGAAHRAAAPRGCDADSAAPERAGAGASRGCARSTCWTRTQPANLYDYVNRQLDALGGISSDEEIIVETFADAVGEARAVVHSPFGGRINGAWALALADALRERTGIEIETQVNDDGILLRFPGTALSELARSARRDHGQ
jgi:ATP-dependent helicase Lhr and Lhr-like helicase